ncbi:MAG: hypothetical protein HC779_08380 [Phyllobacteriaceae bacterium]|nr:hypothetical protein [Phyllobacteriaceae bacterium]
MVRRGSHFELRAPDVGAGQRYGFRLDGPYAPDEGLFHDPAKLIADPYATRFDRPWTYDPRLAAPREAAIDTAPLVPKAVLESRLIKSRQARCLVPAG